MDSSYLDLCLLNSVRPLHSVGVLPPCIQPGNSCQAGNRVSQRAHILYVPSLKRRGWAQVFTAYCSISENQCFITFVQFCVVQDGGLDPVPVTPLWLEAEVPNTF